LRIGEIFLVLSSNIGAVWAGSFGKQQKREAQLLLKLHPSNDLQIANSGADAYAAVDIADLDAGASAAELSVEVMTHEFALHL
jgi:hypothetical protein